MDLERYYELRTILQQWRMRLAGSIRGRIENTARWLDRLRAIYEGEGTGEEFTEWLDRWCRQAAIQFILRVLFLRVLEDRGLLGVTRIRNTDGQQMWAQLTRNLGAARYIQWCCWDAAHLLPDLFGPTEYDLVLPGDDLVQQFLNDVWRRPDPNRGGDWLRFDFRPDPARDDEGFETRFIGDLYQELDAEIRQRYALLQTPGFISQFILEHTLLKRFEELDFREVTLIDPTCGSGHFLVDAFRMFIERYEGVKRKDVKRNSRITNHESRFTHHASRITLPSTQRAEIARTIIEKHLFGCDINAYATALARFRLALAACDYARPTSLRDFRHLRFNLVTIDSLIPYEKLMVGGLQAGSDTAKVLGQPEAIERALPVLRRRYDVVVGNPPYITAKEAIKRNLYREHYESAYMGFGLSAPFTERFLQLAADGGCVGLINSNAFARRQFGKKLIEDVLPRHDLQAVIDLSGAYIPGYGTPTLILLIRNQLPTNKSVTVISNLKGEPSTPADAARGKVWQRVMRGFASKTDYVDEFIDVAASSRESLAQHPWQFGGPASRLYERIRKQARFTLVPDCADSSGFQCATKSDKVFVHSSDFMRRLQISQQVIRPLGIGRNNRDWTLDSDLIIFPYEGEDLHPIKIELFSNLHRFFARYRSILSKRVHFGGKSQVEVGLEWYEYRDFMRSKFEPKASIAFPEIVTHNHFFYDHDRTVFTQSSCVVKLQPGSTPEHYKLLTSLLNTSTTCFCLKQLCFDKRAGKNPVSDTYYDFAGNYVGRTPIPGDYKADTADHRRMLVFAEEMIRLANQLPALALHKLFVREDEAYHAWNSALDGYVAPHPDLPPPFSPARELRAVRDRLVALRQDIRGRMIFLQEEMDWLAYEMYGLLKSKAPLAEDYLSRSDYQAARLELGQRPFEVAGKGYKGDWPEGYQPDPLPEAFQSLTETRIAVIEANPDIALLEDPLYKRRWIPPDYDKGFREAAKWWLAEKLEWALEQHGRPIPLREWARTLGRDERVNAALEALTGTQMFDLEGELLKVIRANAVPNRPEGYLKPAGLRKFYAARGSDPPGTPEYRRKEFSHSTAWKLRGKLNIPRERFIHYVEFDHTRRGTDAPDTGGPWFGWAGWDAARRADALAFLLDRANRAGWEPRWRQCGLRAALRDLLPELKNLPDADRAEFEAIAGMCGIGLGTSCYCQAYRDSIARGEPGVPGVGAEALGVKVLPSEGKQSRRGGKKAARENEQLTLELE